MFFGGGPGEKQNMKHGIFFGRALQIAVNDKSVVSLLAPAYRELRSAELARKVVDGSTAGQFLTS